MSSQYRFTVFTPCYNSTLFLHRVTESLESQSFKDFEWLVINDASTDATDEWVREYIKTAQFPIRYINLAVNQMITANYNLAIKEANGEFLVPLGHDDKILANALERFDQVLKLNDSDQISAVYSLAEDQHGKLTSKKYPKDFQISDYWTIFFALDNEKEKFQCFKTAILRKYPPIDTSVNRSLPAAILWGSVGCDYKAIFINEVLRIYYIEDDNPNALSKSTRSKNPEAIYIYYLLWVNKFQYFIIGNFKRRLKGIAGYVSYGLYAKKTLSEMIRKVERVSNKMLVLFFYPVALFFNWRNSR